MLSDGLRLTEKLKIQKYAYDYRAVGEVEVQQKYRQPAHRTVIAVGAGKLRRSGGMVFLKRKRSDNTTDKYRRQNTYPTVCPPLRKGRHRRAKHLKRFASGC